MRSSMARTVRRNQSGTPTPLCVGLGTYIKLALLVSLLDSEDISVRLIVSVCISSTSPSFVEEIERPTPIESGCLPLVNNTRCTPERFPLCSEHCRAALLSSPAFFSRYLLTHTLSQTIFLCVWQAIHLNVPPPTEPPYRQILRRIRWSILAVLAPEVVALNAWLQYREARRLMEDVNVSRGLARKPRPIQLFPWCSSTRLRELAGHLRRIFTWLGLACIAPPRALDRLRMHLFHEPDLRAFEHEQRQSRNDSLMSQLDNNQLPWTLETAYYANSGAVILVSGYDMGGSLTPAAIRWLAQHESRSRNLLPLQKAALQDPSKASGLVKIIACTQALWFCSQCIARLRKNMAISLLELNTFAHCISAFCIYMFWWDKPYEVVTHVQIDNLELYQQHLFYEANRRTYMKNVGMDAWGHRLPLTINERNADGSMTPLGTARMFLVEVVSMHEIMIGHNIPGTNFAFSTFAIGLSAQRSSVFTTDDGFLYWKQLWDLRTACKLREQPPPLFTSEWKSNRPVCRHRIRNWHPLFVDSLSLYPDSFFFLTPEEDAIGRSSWTLPIMITTFLVYGGIHLLAWQYQFQTKAEGIMWKIASIATASSGLIVLAKDSLNFTGETWIGVIFGLCLLAMTPILFLAAILARTFLVFESFRALPNSPASIYEVPRFTAYLPHI
jgi:hypothetical protein